MQNAQSMKPITPPPKGPGEANITPTPGQQYIARWHFNYDLCDCITGQVEITALHPDGSYTFQYRNPWGTTTWHSNHCRSVELIRQVTQEDEN